MMYRELLKCRQHELAYVAEIMTTLRRMLRSEDRSVAIEAIDEFTPWLANRRKVYPHPETEGKVT
jgi:hypothetical protein